MNKLFNLERFIAEHVIERNESLFKNDLISFEQKLHERANGKSALVIGGAGTIGSSFITALLNFKISSLYVVDTNENGLTELVRNIRSRGGIEVPEEIKTYPMNFADDVFVKMVSEHGPFDIVANFAAHKHVRSEKDQYSIEAMIQNNVIRAKKLLDFLVDNPPEYFFCVSTDKAANPVNVMGASKKLMEDLILSYSDKLNITTARFANVAFSNGSLPFGFLERLAKRQPLSSPVNIRRYFVSPEESGQICLLACLLGESGDIFFPKLDYNKDMKTFSSIAEDLLKEFGFNPDYCLSESEAKQKSLNLSNSSSNYPVYFFESNTTGEKTFEEFFTNDELTDVNSFVGLGVIKRSSNKSREDLSTVFTQLSEAFANQNTTKSDIVNILKNNLKNFIHEEKGRNLDQSM